MSGAAGGTQSWDSSKERNLHRWGRGDGNPCGQGGGICYCVSVVCVRVPACVHVHVGPGDARFLGIVLEGYLEVFRCLLTIFKYLLLWFICCIGYIDSEYRIH